MFRCLHISVSAVMGVGEAAELLLSAMDALESGMSRREWMLSLGLDDSSDEGESLPAPPVRPLPASRDPKVLERMIMRSMTNMRTSRMLTSRSRSRSPTRQSFSPSPSPEPAVIDDKTEGGVTGATVATVTTAGVETSLKGCGCGTDLRENMRSTSNSTCKESVLPGLLGGSRGRDGGGSDGSGSEQVRVVGLGTPPGTPPASPQTLLLVPRTPPVPPPPTPTSPTTIPMSMETMTMNSTDFTDSSSSASNVSDETDDDEMVRTLP